jgi:2,3-bisphosphoglycerate-independent phosphoglycerate mutase
MFAKRLMLIILDGWGINPDPSSSAIARAKTPCMNALMENWPHSTLTTFGEEVGLPFGQMGNSEVGHLNIGAGRVVYQELLRINKAVESGELGKNQILQELFDYCIQNNKPLHLLGLIGDGGVHAHSAHLLALAQYATEAGLRDIHVHAFTDGRDTDPRSGLGFVKDLEAGLAKTSAKIRSLCGRYYAMDRDKRWERVKLAYDLLVGGKGNRFESAEDALKASYAAGVSDEFVLPVTIGKQDESPISIKNGDAVLVFNFRTDRCREITQVLSQKAFPEHDMQPLDLQYATMTNYDSSFKGVEVLLNNDHLRETLGEVIESNGLKQIRIAETEKYPHVTFFFSGGREKEFEGEKRILIPSPKVATYDLQPEMSAPGLTEAILPEIRNKSAEFICLNFANTDMVGHTGVMDAAVKAAETVDLCLQQIVDTAIASDYTLFIIADHGNADMMINEDGSPNTAHSKNPVPCILVNGPPELTLKPGKLADIAPSILELMNLKKPNVMSGNSLLKSIK